MPRKKRLFFLIITGLGALILHAAAPRLNKEQGYWEFDTYTFSGPRGTWTDAQAWVKGSVPPKGDIVEVYVTGGTTLTISTPTATIARFRAGSLVPKKTCIHIKSGAKIQSYFLSVPFPNLKDAQVDLEMEGGELSVGAELKNNGVIAVGNQGTTFSGNATFAIRAGKLLGCILVGNDTPNTNTGVFRVIGSKAEIKGPEIPSYASNYFGLYASGTLEFVLDERGASTLNYPLAKCPLRDGGTVRVDGKNYTGPVPRRIALLTAGKIEKGNIKTECVNFSGCRAEIVFDEKNMILKLSK